MNQTKLVPLGKTAGLLDIVTANWDGWKMSKGCLGCRSSRRHRLCWDTHGPTAPCPLSHVSRGRSSTVQLPVQAHHNKKTPELSGY